MRAHVAHTKLARSQIAIVCYFIVYKPVMDLLSFRGCGTLRRSDTPSVMLNFSPIHILPCSTPILLHLSAERSHSQDTSLAQVYHTRSCFVAHPSHSPAPIASPSIDSSLVCSTLFFRMCTSACMCVYVYVYS